MQTIFSRFFFDDTEMKKTVVSLEKVTLKIPVQLCQIEMENWISSKAVILNFFFIFMLYIFIYYIYVYTYIYAIYLYIYAFIFIFKPQKWDCYFPGN